MYKYRYNWAAYVRNCLYSRSYNYIYIIQTALGLTALTCSAQCLAEKVEISVRGQGQLARDRCGVGVFNKANAWGLAFSNSNDFGFVRPLSYHAAEDSLRVCLSPLPFAS